MDELKGHAYIMISKRADAKDFQKKAYTIDVNVPDGINTHLDDCTEASLDSLAQHLYFGSLKGIPLGEIRTIDSPHLDFVGYPNGLLISPVSEQEIVEFYEAYQRCSKNFVGTGI